jgi:integrase/recombinase XerD
MTLKDVNLTMKFVTCADDERGRIIPFGSMAGIALKNYIDGARNNLNPEDDILFPNCDGKKMTRQGFWKIVKQYGKACGLEDRLTPHIFRNSFAAHMIEGGADLKSIQEMLGHADISTTQNYAAATHVGISSVYSSAHPRK